MTRLETERLILRPINAKTDFDGWAKIMSDEETVRFIGGKVMTRTEAWRNMAMVMGAGEIRGYTFLAVEEKSSGDFIGRIGPWYPEGWPSPEIGWTLMREHWGKGYAKEAAQACLDLVFKDWNWPSVIHVIAKENIGSIKVAEAIGSQFLRDHVVPGFEHMEIGLWGQDNTDYVPD